MGGKNGVNYRGYKNLIGVFNQPRFVICDFELLKSLPMGELRCGYAEVIKHALIGDAPLFAYLEAALTRGTRLRRRGDGEGRPRLPYRQEGYRFSR